MIDVECTVDGRWRRLTGGSAEHLICQPGTWLDADFAPTSTSDMLKLSLHDRGLHGASYGVRRVYLPIMLRTMLPNQCVACFAVFSFLKKAK